MSHKSEKDLRREKRERQLLAECRAWHVLTRSGGRTVDEDYTKVPVRVISQACANGAERDLLRLIRLKMDGKAAIVAKSSLRGWKRLVSNGWARESKHHIHALPWSAFAEDHRAQDGTKTIRGMTTVRFGREQLNAGVPALFHVLQEYYLRVDNSSKGEGPTTPVAFADRKQAGGHSPCRLRKAVKAGKRTAKDKGRSQSPHAGGVCLEAMAAMFNRTRPWASQMRRKLEEAGMCSYRRRWVEATPEEAVAAKLCGEGGPYSRRSLCTRKGTRAGVFREVTSLAVPVLLLTFSFVMVEVVCG